MLKFLQIIIALLVIIVIVPQTPPETWLVRVLVDTGWFMNYDEAKQILKRVTWGLVFLFFTVTFAVQNLA